MPFLKAAAGLAKSFFECEGFGEYEIMLRAEGCGVCWFALVVFDGGEALDRPLWTRKSFLAGWRSPRLASPQPQITKQPPLAHQLQLVAGIPYTAGILHITPKG